MQARLDQEAEEYAKLMEQHARRTAPTAAGDGKKKKKKKQKKDAAGVTAAAAAAADTAAAADPIPESAEADVAEFEHYDPEAFEKAAAAGEGEEWCAASPQPIQIHFTCLSAALKSAARQRPRVPQSVGSMPAHDSPAQCHKHAGSLQLDHMRCTPT